jgi:cytochrome P450
MPSTPTPDFARDLTMPPFEWHRRMCEWSRFMRDTEPVSYSEETKCWRVYRYDDVTRVLNDYATFSSEHRTADQSLVSVDPPRHRQLRGLVTDAFSVRTIAQMAPRIAEFARDLLMTPLERGEMDAVSEFATPLPIRVIATMLGLPLDDCQVLCDWSSVFAADLRNGTSPTALLEAQQETMQTAGEVYQYFAGIIEERRGRPGQDLISHLIAAEIAGQRLSEAELLSFCVGLLLAGNITTTQLIGNALLCFNEHPEVWQQLLQNRSLVPSAIEETLRYLPPADKGLAENTVFVEGRVVTMDVMLGGQLIRKGGKVNVSTLSANFDERQFPDPERFDIERTPNHHLTFGHGIHFCIGAPLARLEAKIALETLLETIPRWSIQRGTQLELIPCSYTLGVKQFPIVIGQ